MKYYYETTTLSEPSQYACNHMFYLTGLLAFAIMLFTFSRQPIQQTNYYEVHMYEYEEDEETLFSEEEGEIVEDNEHAATQTE